MHVRLGDQRKQTPLCNGGDRTFVRHESVPTSDWSLIVREIEEP